MSRTLRPVEKRAQKAGVGFLAGGSEPPSHQLGGLRERCKLPQTQRGTGRMSPGKFLDFGQFWVLRNYVRMNLRTTSESVGTSVDSAPLPKEPPLNSVHFRHQKTVLVEESFIDHY